MDAGAQDRLQAFHRGGIAPSDRRKLLSGLRPYWRPRFHLHKEMRVLLAGHDGGQAIQSFPPAQFPLGACLTLGEPIAIIELRGGAVW
jgi:hypothetical protein